MQCNEEAAQRSCGKAWLGRASSATQHPHNSSTAAPIFSHTEHNVSGPSRSRSCDVSETRLLIEGPRALCWAVTAGLSLSEQALSVRSRSEQSSQSSELRNAKAGPAGKRTDSNKENMYDEAAVSGLGRALQHISMAS